MKIDRRSIVVRDLVEAEELYVHILGETCGAYLANRYMLTTDDLVYAQKAATVARKQGAVEDASEMALPYSRVIVGAARQSHVYLQLSSRHWQEPPLPRLRGAPRLAFAVTPEQLERGVEALRRTDIPFEGPKDYPAPAPIARAVYFKDRSGNFLELACPADPASIDKGGEFHRVMLEVANLNRARHFYEDTIGLPCLGSDLFPEEGSHLAFGLDDSREFLVLVEEPTAQPAPPLTCTFFSLTNAEWPALTTRLKRDQCTEVPDPRGGLRGAGELRLRVRDLDGHALELHTFEDAFHELPPAGRGKIAVGRPADFPIGSVTRVPEGKFYLTHLEGGFLAISEICTHRQFTVVYQPEHFCFGCPLHGNRYSQTGKLVHRGARDNTPPLHTYPIELRDGVIVVDTDIGLARAEEDAEVLVPLPL